MFGRRVLCYPLYRHFDLVTMAISDVVRILQSGETKRTSSCHDDTQRAGILLARYEVRGPTREHLQFTPGAFCCHGNWSLWGASKGTFCISHLRPAGIL